MTAVSGGGDSSSPIKSICFDAFVTLSIPPQASAVSGVVERSYVMLSEATQGRRAADVLISPHGLRDIAKNLAIKIGEARLLDLEGHLAAECQSIRPCPGSETIWASLRRAGLRIGGPLEPLPPIRQAAFGRRAAPQIGSFGRNRFPRSEERHHSCSSARIVRLFDCGGFHEVTSLLAGARCDALPMVENLKDFFKVLSRGAKNVAIRQQTAGNWRCALR
jgi:hypothetical protein